jgi:hypothetical protein
MVNGHAGWQNPRVLATLLMVFLAGALSGALIMRAGLHTRLHGGELKYEQLRNELNLNPKQAEEIRSILDDFVKYNQDLQNQIEDVRATGKNRIMSILDPDQRKRFQKICEQLQ